MMIIGLLFIFMNVHLHYERLKKHITILQQQQKYNYNTKQEKNSSQSKTHPSIANLLDLDSDYTSN